MKKIVKTIIFLLTFLLIIVTTVQVVSLVVANPHPGPGDPSINVVYSPDFSTNSIILKIDVTVWQDTNKCTRAAWYSLDGQKNISIPLTFKGMISEGTYYSFSEVTGETRIPMWSQDPHTLNVTVVYNYGNFISAGSKTLYIGQPEPTPPAPILTIISPQNQITYYNNQVPIIYNLNLKVIWSYYALDTVGRPETSDWKVFTGNFTLSGLAAGSHRIIISVKAETDFVPDFTEKTIEFKVDSSNEPNNDSSTQSSDSTSSPIPLQNSSTIDKPIIASNSSTNPLQSSLLESFPWLPIAAVSVVVAAVFVVAVLVVYLKKRHTSRELN